LNASVKNSLIEVENKEDENEEEVEIELNWSSDMLYEADSNEERQLKRMGFISVRLKSSPI
jgi:hypothetical protein